MMYYLVKRHQHFDTVPVVNVNLTLTRTKNFRSDFRNYSGIAKKDTVSVLGFTARGIVCGGFLVMLAAASKNRNLRLLRNQRQ